MPATATLGAMKQSIQDVLGRSSQLDDDAVTLEIINSLNHYKWHSFWFNTGVFTFTGVASTGAYTRNAIGTARGSLTGPPYDTLAILRMEWRDPDDATRRHDIQHQSVDYVRDRLDSNTTGYPRSYAWLVNTASDASEDDPSLLFEPTFDKAYDIYADYIQDIGVPGANYTGGAWVFVNSSDESTTLTDSYTNAWFTHGFELIRARTIRNIYLTLLYNPDRAAAWAQVEAEALRNLRSSSNSWGPALSVKPWGMM